jgi:hypothetical protein
MQVFRLGDNQTHVTTGANFICRDEDAGMAKGFQGDHPIIPHCVLDVHVVAEDNGVKFALRQSEECAQHDLYAGTDVSLLCLLELVIRAPTGARRLDYVVYDLTQQIGDLLSQLPLSSGHTFELVGN